MPDRKWLELGTGEVYRRGHNRTILFVVQRVFVTDYFDRLFPRLAISQLVRGAKIVLGEQLSGIHCGFARQHYLGTFLGPFLYFRFR